MIHDKISNFKLYKFGESWEEAFEFIKSVNEQTEERRHELADGMFANIESYPTKSLEKAIFESHREYIDIQFTIIGSEKIGYASINDLTVKKPYNEKSDVIFYEHPQEIFSEVTNHEGYFTLLFPEDAHMPGLRTSLDERVKKGVVKVPVKLL